MFIGIYVKDLFLGTPEQFDDAYGGGIEWNQIGDTPRGIETICDWTQCLDTKPTDIVIQEFPTEGARGDWFRRVNEKIDGTSIIEIDDVEWATAHVMNTLIDVGLGEQVNQLVDVVAQLQTGTGDVNVAIPQILGILGFDDYESAN